MTQESGRRTRSTLAGCAAQGVTAVLVLLIGVGPVVAVAVPRILRQTGTIGGGAARQEGGLTRDPLRWGEPTVTRIVVSHEPGPTCYRFEVPVPLGPEVIVSSERLNQNPALSKTTA
ncbi:hypothetical protein [Streptomyces sp. NPDC005407]|uniref:hypothetical protein n=1 Tax=Streptomyces sp. NPDC005407 TaxID=3155340 RepID=UPI0033A0C783